MCKADYRSVLRKCIVPVTKTEPYPNFLPLVFRVTTRFRGLRSVVGNLRVVRGGHFSSGGDEQRGFQESCFVRDEAGCRRHYSQSIFHAAFEVDGRGFLEVTRRAGDLADAKTEHDRLGKHLIVEDEVVRVFEQWKGLKHFL